MALGVIGVVALLLTLYLMRRRNVKKSQRAEKGGIHPDHPPGLGTQGQRKAIESSLKDGKGWNFLQELDAERRVSDLHSTAYHRSPAELVG